MRILVRVDEKIHGAMGRKGQNDASETRVMKNLTVCMSRLLTRSHFDLTSVHFACIEQLVHSGGPKRCCTPYLFVALRECGRLRRCHGFGRSNHIGPVVIHFVEMVFERCLQ